MAFPTRPAPPPPAAAPAAAPLTKEDVEARVEQCLRSELSRAKEITAHAMSSEEQLDAAKAALRATRHAHRAVGVAAAVGATPSDDGYSADALRFKFDDSALRVTDAYGEELEAPTAAMAVAFDASLRLDAGPASSSNVALVHALVDVLRRYPRVVLEAHVPPSLALAAAKPKALAHHLGVGPAAPADETAVRPRSPHRNRRQPCARSASPLLSSSRDV